MEDVGVHDNQDTIQICVIVPMSLEKQSKLRREIEKNEELKTLKAMILNEWPEDRAEIPEKLQYYWPSEGS